MGLWLKEMKIDDFNNCKTEKEIKDNYLIFEKNMNKIYNEGNINDIPLLNPLNYFPSYRFNKASEKDSDLCLFSKYLKEMANIKDNTEPVSDKTIQTLDKTISSLKDNLSSQIQSIAILSNSIKNNNILSGTIKNEISDDTEKKLKAIENLINQLQNNKNVVEQYISKNKKGKVILKTCELINITKSLDVENYLKDIGIPYYYETTFQKAKNWFGMIGIIVIGACEIALGVILTYYMKNDFGLLEEGMKDIEYGINCILEKEEFGWKDVGKRKITFVISFAVNVEAYFIKNNLKLPFTKSDKPAKIGETFQKIGEKIKSQLIKKGVNIWIGLSMKLLGKDFIVTIVAKFKDFSKSINIQFFQKK